MKFPPLTHLAGDDADVRCRAFLPFTSLPFPTILLLLVFSSSFLGEVLSISMVAKRKSALPTTPKILLLTNRKRNL